MHTAHTTAPLTNQVRASLRPVKCLLGKLCLIDAEHAGWAASLCTGASHIQLLDGIQRTTCLHASALSQQLPCELSQQIEHMTGSEGPPCNCYHSTHCPYSMCILPSGQSKPQAAQAAVGQPLPDSCRACWMGSIAVHSNLVPVASGQHPRGPFACMPQCGLSTFAGQALPADPADCWIGRTARRYNLCFALAGRTPQERLTLMPQICPPGLLGRLVRSRAHCLPIYHCCYHPCKSLRILPVQEAALPPGQSKPESAVEQALPGGCRACWTGDTATHLGLRPSGQDCHAIIIILRTAQTAYARYHHSRASPEQAWGRLNGC